MSLVKKGSTLINNHNKINKKPIKKTSIKYKTSLHFNLITKCKQQKRRMIINFNIKIKMNHNNSILINNHYKRIKEAFLKHITINVEYVKTITNN